MVGISLFRIHKNSKSPSPKQVTVGHRDKTFFQKINIENKK